jgi:hypothetical protein
MSNTTQEPQYKGYFILISHENDQEIKIDYSIWKHLKTLVNIVKDIESLNHESIIQKINITDQISMKIPDHNSKMSLEDLNIFVEFISEISLIDDKTNRNKNEEILSKYEIYLINFLNLCNYLDYKDAVDMIGSYISKYFIEGKTENEILEIFQKSIKTNEINFDITKDEIKESCKELGWNYEIII